jgi:hypothetical protein
MENGTAAVRRTNMLQKRHPRDLIWIYLAVVFAGVLVSAGGSRAKPAKSPAGFYQGSGTARRVADLRVATLISNYNSDFWFTIDAQGNVDGYGTVRYELRLDDSKLRSLIALANSTFGKANSVLLSGIPGLAEVLDITKVPPDILGVTARYNETMPSREGKIKGRVTGEGLHLEWATPPPTIPYTTYSIHMNGEKVRRQETAPAYSPWIADARLLEAAPGQWQAFVTGEAAHRTTASNQIFAFWTAHRVAPGE